MLITLTNHETQVTRQHVLNALKRCEAKKIDWSEIHEVYRKRMGKLLEWKGEVSLTPVQFGAYRDTIEAYVTELTTQNEESLRVLMEEARLEWITTWHFAMEREYG